MHRSIRWSVLSASAAALLGAAPALAQTTSGGRSFVPYTTGGYAGLNVGRPEYKLGCSAAFNCDDPDGSVHIYTGGKVNEWLGAEVGYVYLGKADRQGGSTRGHGINLSVVGSFPVAQSFSVFGKVGTTYGWTDVTANSAANEPVGDDDGFGLSFGAGVQYDFTPQWALVAQWDRHHLKFAGRDRENADVLSIGAKYKF